MTEMENINTENILIQKQWQYIADNYSEKMINKQYDEWKKIEKIHHRLKCYEYEGETTKCKTCGERILKQWKVDEICYLCDKYIDPYIHNDINVDNYKKYLLDNFHTLTIEFGEVKEEEEDSTEENTAENTEGKNILSNEENHRLTMNIYRYMYTIHKKLKRHFEYIPISHMNKSFTLRVFYRNKDEMKRVYLRIEKEIKTLDIGHNRKIQIRNYSNGEIYEIK